MNDINNINIAKAFNYHHCYLNKLIKASTGTTLHKYIMECRVNAAINLIANTNFGIEYIALRCGFKNHAHFSTYFKKITGKSPIEYKNKIGSVN